MSMIAVIEQPVTLAMSEDIDFPSWVETMRGLFDRRRQVEWVIADGLRIGRERFADEPQMQMFLEQVNLDRRDADEMAKVARLIPEGWRTDRLSFDVCRKIAKIDDETDRQRMLKQAVDERWNEKKAHHHLVEYRYQHGDIFDDEDTTTRLATVLVREWNRLPIAAREYVFPLIEMAAAKGFGPIDEDAAV